MDGSYAFTFAPSVGQPNVYNSCVDFSNSNFSAQNWGANSKSKIYV